VSALRTVWKFQMLGRAFGVQMPCGARVLTVQLQNDDPVIWALVDPLAPAETREFYMAMTGESFDAEGYEYVGTYQAGWFVGHLFAKAA
jgi:hypothetical protein